jgi:hypothetical protein
VFGILLGILTLSRDNLLLDRELWLFFVQSQIWHLDLKFLHILLLDFGQEILIRLHLSFDRVEGNLIQYRVDHVIHTLIS